ncbi:MAG TPA: hypothetical protein VI076_04285 [Actinopolymorphaceae bacterium]
MTTGRDEHKLFGVRVALLLVGLGLVGIGLYAVLRLPALPGVSRFRWRNVELYSTSVGFAIVVLGVVGVAAATFLPEPPPSASPGPSVTVTTVHTPPPVTIPPGAETDPPTAPPGSSTEGPDRSPTPEPSTDPVDVPEEDADESTGPAEGTRLARYSLELPSGYVIRRFDDRPAQPEQSAALGYDLWWTGLTSTFRSGHRLSLLEKPNPSYRDCRDNTRFRQFVVAVDRGQTLCFTGHRVVAAATIAEPVREYAAYVALDIVVWQGR